MTPGLSRVRAVPTALPRSCRAWLRRLGAASLLALVSADAGPVLEVRGIGGGAADLVVFAGGAQEGWQVGMRAEVRRAGLAPASLLVVAVGERSAAALIEDAPEGVAIQAGDEVSARITSNPR